MKKQTAFLGERLNNLSFLTMMPKSNWQESDLQFRVVPVQERQNHRTPVWRVVLRPAVKSPMPPLALELHGDVVIGSNPEADGELDINLASWQGYERGVSRRHAMLRPSKNKLFIMDLRSTNGTHINGLPLGVGWAYALQDGDVITMGRLHMSIRIVQQPEEG